MLHDRIVDNKEIRGKIWKICTAFSNDLYSVERFVLRWMICTTLNDLCYVKWYTLHWMICTTLNELYYVEWFVLRWIICTALSYLFRVEWFVQRWMIFTTLKNLYDVEWFGVICATLNHLDYDELLSIGFLMNAGCAYSRKYCKIFYTNLWVDFFLFANIKRKYIRPCPRNWS